MLEGGPLRGTAACSEGEPVSLVRLVSLVSVVCPVSLVSMVRLVSVVCLRPGGEVFSHRTQERSRPSFSRLRLKIQEIPMLIVYRITIGPLHRNKLKGSVVGETTAAIIVIMSTA